MNKSILFFIAAGLLLLAGCVKEPDRAETGSITVRASVGPMTKVSYDGYKTGFTAGDRIAVYGWTGGAAAVPATRVVNGVVNTLGTDGNWTPEEKMIWQSSTGAHYFLAVSPVRSISDFTKDSYTLVPDDYAASDLLIATNLDGVTSGDGPVDLAFGHAMAKLAVNLRFGSDWEATPAVNAVKVVARTGADINYLGTPVVTATGDVSDVSLAATASAPDGYAYSYDGLQVPQDGVRTITVVIGNDEYLYEAANDIPLSPGKYTTIGLAVVGHELVAVGSVTLSDWADGAGLPGGSAQTKLDEPIVFADSGLGSYLVAEKKRPIVDLNHDGEISKYEAKLVKSLNDLFDTGSATGRSYRLFNEFQYFTGITEIPDGSFNHWTNLEEITLPESITTIGGGRNDDAGIFQDCPALKAIKGKFTQNNAIVYNNQLLRVAPAVVYDGQFIPDGVEIIGNRAVSHSSTSDLFIPSSVKKIRTNAFEYSKIEIVRFAMTDDDPMMGTAFVDSLAETAFNHCFKVKKFIGPKKNGSLLVTPDQVCLILDTTFFAYALSADKLCFSIPEELGVKRIASGAFDLTDEAGHPVGIHLMDLGLPTTIQHIRTLAFRNTQYIKVWFKGENPPTRVEDGAFNWAKEFVVLFPAVMSSADHVDRDATDAREAVFRAALGSYIGITEYVPSQWNACFD